MSVKYKDLVDAGIHVYGQGPAIVLLHSSLSSAKQWAPMISQLSASFRLICVDLLGYGSAPTVLSGQHYSFDDEVHRINRCLTALDITSFHLVGHSCGGALALKLAVEQPKQLKSLVLFEPVAFHLLSTGSEERAVAEKFSSQIENLDDYQAAQVFTDFWNRIGFFQSLPSRAKQSMVKEMFKVSLDFHALMSEHYQLADLTAITCSSLLMKGENSPHLSRYLAKQIANYLPNATLNVYDVGHMAPLSDSQLIQGAIADFIIQQEIKKPGV